MRARLILRLRSGSFKRWCRERDAYEQAFIDRWGFSGEACGVNPYKSNLYAGLAPRYGGYEPTDLGRLG